VYVVRPGQGGVHIRGIGKTFRPLVDPVELYPRVQRSLRYLVDVDMTSASADHLVAGLGQHPDGYAVGHRPAGHEDGPLEAQHPGDPLLEGVHRGVLSEHIVAHVGMGHGIAHAQGGDADGVASQIYPEPAHRSSQSPVAGLESASEIMASISPV